MGEKVSLREYARQRGVRLSAVQRAIKSGRINKTNDGKIDVDSANKDWFEHTDPSKSHKVDPYFEKEVKRTMGNSALDNTTNFQKVKAAEVYYRAMTAKTKLKQLIGELIDKKMAGEHTYRLAQAIKNAILGFPARYSSLIAAEIGVDEHKMLVVLNEYLRKFLSECRDVFDRHE